MTRVDPLIFQVVAVVLWITAEAPAARVRVPVVLSSDHVIVSVVIARLSETDASFSNRIRAPIPKTTEAFAGIVKV